MYKHNAKIIGKLIIIDKLIKNYWHIANMIDKTDRIILNELRQDAARPVTKLARYLDLPRSTLQHRIEKMRKSGVIKRTVAIPDYEKIGLPVTAIVLVTFLPTHKGSQHDVAQAIANIENIVEVHVVAGSWDIIVKARGSSLREIGELVVDKLRRVPGVGQTMTCGCFFTLKEEP
jgi:Lrp/AsnC family leucine-responsive transcriptional regulator